MSSGTYNRKDHLYEKAKQEGYRSRAAYKLIELDKKYNLLKQGSAVIDLGAWPGGWLQVAAKKAGDYGLVVGIDLVEIEAVDEGNVELIKGDIRDDETLEAARALLKADKKTGFDLVLSDMSHKLTGIREVDAVASIGLVEMAFWAAEQMLRPQGNFVAKVFKSNETELFFKATRPKFEKLVRQELDATRKTSNEFYLVGLGYKK